MCIDLIEEGSNAFLADVEDADFLAERVSELLDDDGLRQSVVDNGLRTARDHTWASIARRYDEEVYRPLTICDGP